MTRQKGLSDYIRFCAALSSGIITGVNFIDNKSIILKMKSYCFVPRFFKRSSYMSVVSRLITQKEISRSLNNKGEVYLKLLPKGRNRLTEKYPRIFVRNECWDGCYMLVFFDIAECERLRRNKFRRELLRLGFGMMQRSVWISPHHFEEVLRGCMNSLSLENNAFIIEGKKFKNRNKKVFAKKIWKLDMLAERYQMIINEFKRLNKKINWAARKKLFNCYLDVYSKDPLLPKELLPDNWPREEAVNCIMDLTDTNL